ncbi:sporulation-control protein [Bacillus mesophilus]|uniref:Sporulation protein n=1 Tax=Bacillus mesophilus TaxID=1808955 RepID=A0A6M0QBM7_9BACI|nr:sporulation protein [Bacillus mesophilus]MBM7660097.1 sporulation-control protein [Bacillus mesophilus]NEY73752.1 sporulation protein [Bacillus mesophilus]
MILRKYMSLLGVGSARIDLILPKETYRPGDNIVGYFKIVGGTVEQQINRIDSDLVLIDKTKETEQVIDSTTILTKKLINSTEENELSFTFKLPVDVPVSSDEISYRFHTKLTFNKGVESRDQDIIKIV